ncbi:MAG: type ISP restriction/modification enzyme [Candidatus Acidiferrales bacterium]
MPFKEYLAEIQRNLASDISREQTHRHALQDLLESLDPTIQAFNDPAHIEVGAPDFTVRRKGNAMSFPVGWVETKDVGEALDPVEKSEQMERYFGLPNLVLSDYLEFRWYTDGKRRMTARIATVGRGRKLLRDREGEEAALSLLTEFLGHSIASAVTPKELAERMARLAHIIRGILLGTFRAEGDSGWLHNQFQAFRETLIPDLEPDAFADMYAQTIAYGLFAARCQPRTTPEKFTRATAAELIPRTNPFLRRLFREIAFDLDARVMPFVDDLVALLCDADIGSIMADFGKRTAKEDPVVHFYEDFLQEYDPKLRELRGVYYTPEPVVSYIVRSVDRILKTEFNKPLGLADRDVLVLDPACGTGTFLYYVIRHIHEALVQEGQKGQWNSYVSENLLKRVFGFELLMAPYAVAHLKLGLQLQDLGYKFESDERLGVYLTNTLEEAARKSEIIFAQWIADEANAASEIKRDKPIMVVLGNPPYSGHSANRSWEMKNGKKVPTFIGGLLQDYYHVDGKPLGEKTSKWLQDDYVKFIRFGQWRIQRTGYGILAFITNHGYLDNPTFRGMRQQLMNAFSEIATLDLHGNSKKKETAPDGGKDKNVFDIQQGVAIGLFAKQTQTASKAKLRHGNLFGLRESKYKTLEETDISDTQWVPLNPSAPNFLFVPHSDKLWAEYEKGWRLTEIMAVKGPGMTTARDHVVIDYEEKPLLQRVTLFRDSTDPLNEICRALDIPEKKGWNASRAREMIQKERNLKSLIFPVGYRPFDTRLIFYHDSLVWRTVKPVMRPMQHKGNIGLLATRQTKDKWDVFVVRHMVTHKSLSAYDITTIFPLYLLQENGKSRSLFDQSTKRKPNIFSKVASELAGNMKLKLEHDGQGDLQTTLGPEDILHYIYAVLYSPSYRKRYAEFLKSDFPRVPLTSDKSLFVSLAAKGAELVTLHLLESLSLSKLITRYEQPGEHRISKARYAEPNSKAGINAGRVYINDAQYFEGVPKEAWEFQIGGYQVCEKWLKDRKDRKLSSDDIEHYQRIVVALNETIRIIHEIDTIIPGWPLP